MISHFYGLKFLRLKVNNTIRPILLVHCLCPINISVKLVLAKIEKYKKNANMKRLQYYIAVMNLI